MHRLSPQKVCPETTKTHQTPDLARRLALLTSSATALAWVVGNISGCAARVAPPDVNFTLLDGTPSSLWAWRGQVVLVNFWATSCAVCVREMPLLAATQRQYAERGFQTLAVAMQFDAPAAVAMFAQARALPFAVVIDNLGAVARSFGDVRATPTSFVLDRNGMIAKTWVGAPKEAALHGVIEKLLAAA